ncbi:maltoporin [Solimicrobium silvestre]|uniref:Maltoporin (Phage lambda and maltose receptor) n=1 Tax=Solimicrobium silvestre TaxID=2099400 RepID=A0A2S9H4V1_9BURK|nr:carbohydrate porin [Solimicrobium silvestre]PRC94971.1 Maltoporin (phage lambda and maltose receptor) [Solimicrobium silvestre]
MINQRLKALPFALALALPFIFACGVASADAGHDEDGFHGYLRAGAGASSTGGPQSCFGLGGNTMKYRLGNECDSYFEGGYTKDLATVDDGVIFTGTLWANAWSPNSNFSGATLSLAKAYVEAKNLDFLNGGVAWVGERYYYRPDIHFLDLQFINLNGTGGGIDGIKAGPGKFSYAMFKDNDTNGLDAATGAVTTSRAGLRQNFLYEGLPVNPGGTIDAVATIISATGENNHSGWNLTALHKQEIWGGGNTFAVQYGVGAGTGTGATVNSAGLVVPSESGAGSQGNGRMGNAGSTLLGSDVTRLRVFDELVIQPTKQFSTEFIALYQKDTSDALGSSVWTTIGARPVYAVNRHFKLQMEAGVEHVTFSNGTPSEDLTKVTFAPTIAMGEAYWSRPELRFFVTYGKWNNAATAAVNANNNSGPVYNNGTSGTSAGVQLEAWW